MRILLVKSYASHLYFDLYYNHSHEWKCFCAEIPTQMKMCQGNSAISDDDEKHRKKRTTEGMTKKKRDSDESKLSLSPIEKQNLW